VRLPFTISFSEDNALYFVERVQRGRPKRDHMLENEELIEYAKEQHIPLPTGHLPARMEMFALQNDAAKYLKFYHFCPDREVLSRAIRCFYASVDLSITTTLTFEEAVLKMDLTKSPGYPWNIGYQNKHLALLDNYGIVRGVVDQILSGQPVCYEFRGVTYRSVYWYMSPKGEIRERSKVVNEDRSKIKTRTFMCGDLIMQIVGLMLYKNQNDEMHVGAAGRQFSAIGISKQYGGWDDLAKVLLSDDYGQASDPNQVKFDCFDCKHMEASLGPEVQSIIYELRNSYLVSKHLTDHELDNLKRFYFDNLCYGVIVGLEGEIFMKFGKNPSGGFNTADDNTLALDLAFWYFTCKEFPTIPQALAHRMFNIVKGYGDDSVARACAAYRRCLTDADEIGFEFTIESFGSLLEGSTFLSNVFHFDRNWKKWIAIPNYDKLRASLYYDFKEKNWPLVWAKTCALRTLCWHNKEIVRETDRIFDFIEKEHSRELILGDPKRQFDLLSMKSMKLDALTCDMLTYGVSNESLYCALGPVN